MVGTFDNADVLIDLLDPAQAIARETNAPHPLVITARGFVSGGVGLAAGALAWAIARRNRLRHKRE